MPTEVDKNLREEIMDVYHHPHGKDPCLGLFYGAVLQIVDKGEPLSNILVKIKQQRDITDKHLVNLLFRSIQAIEFDQGRSGYRDFTTTDEWEQEITRITSDPKLSVDFRRILRTRSTGTTIYQRYAGPYAVISHKYDGSGVRVADLGCGGNYGLRGIELSEPFAEIEDHTPQKYLTALVNQKINLTEGIAIDKQDPDIPSNKKWRLACSFYPQELDQLPTIKAFEDRIVKTERVSFKKKDLLSCHGLPKDSIDVAILSTVLYQLSSDEQQALLEKARCMLIQGGTLIIQDFAERNPGNMSKLDFTESWAALDYAYRTFVTGKDRNSPYLEALTWYNGRCRKVKPGGDFNLVFGPHRIYVPKPAFAIQRA